MAPFAIAAALVMGIVALGAQTPTFRAGVEVVRIDVTALGANRMPVRGLAASDFTVLEDGKPRPIIVFDAVDIPEVPPPAPDEAAWLRTAPRDVVSNRVDERRIFLIIMDDATLPMEPRMIERAKAIAMDVVSRMTDSDRAAVVFTANSAKAQPFTADRSRLLAAINAMQGGNLFRAAPLFGKIGDTHYYAGAITTITQSVETLLATPQGRKTLVLISTGIPMDPSTGTPSLSTISPSPTSSTRGENDMQQLMLEETSTQLRAAERGHVSIYTFDPGGATGLEDYVNLYLTQSGTNPQAAMWQAADHATRARDFLVDQASATGGRAVVGTADAGAGVMQMFRENSAYYLIGFQSADTNVGRRRLEIRTSKPGVVVQSRHSFEVAAPNPKDKARPVNPLIKAITGVLPEGNLPMRVSAVPLAAPNGSGGIVAITLGIHQPVGAERTTEKVEVQVNAYRPDGHFVTSTRLDAQLVLRGSESGGAQYEFLAKLPLSPGRYQLRIAANCPAIATRRSVFADVDVPDFSKAEVSLSGLALTMTPATSAAPPNAFAGLLPSVPTLPRDPRGGRAADYSFEIPVVTLGSGDYLLTVTAALPDGVTVERTLRFSRR